jgi:hypothetical protein
MGVISADVPSLKRAGDKTLIPGIKARGGQVIDKVYVQPTANDVAAGISAAVLRFKQQGINRVIDFAPYGGLWLIFAREAEGQGYRPDYGLTTYDDIRYVSRNIPPEQLAGSKGAGFFLSWDVSSEAQPPPTSIEKRCFEIMKKYAGASFNERGDKFQTDGLKYCDAFTLMREALAPATGRKFAPEQVHGLYTSIGSRFTSAQYANPVFGRRKLDAISTFAPLAYYTDCGCFKYTTRGWQKVPF